tara:strand:+ start:144 stop:296 length:153 start_codon:yes stop_codon:yes gene_type:complete
MQKIQFQNPKYRPDFARYEREKQDWMRRHPASTPEQYQAAMRAIAARCGV